MKNTLPVLLLKNLLLLPNQEVKLELNNDLSRNVVLLAVDSYRNQLIVLAPKDQIEEIPEISDFPKIAVVAKVKNKLELPNGNLRVTLRGLFRAETKNFRNDDSLKDTLICSYQKLEVPSFNEVEALALQRKLHSLLSEYVSKGKGVSNSILHLIKETSDLNKLTDLIVTFLPLSFLRKLEYVEEINPVVRGNFLIDDLHLELEIIKLDQKLDQKLQNGLEESQKEFILKERLHEIQEELGEFDVKEKEMQVYLDQLENLHLENSRIREKIKSEIKKFEYTSEASPELSNIRNYLDWMLHLPWQVYSEDETDLKVIQKSLDQSHYGMEKVKSKVLEYIAAKNRNPEVNGPILCLIGPAGVGKTTLAKSIARSLKKEFYKISVGGLNDSSILNGHRRTYIGANPGKIMEGIKRCGTSNPLLLIDEVDKMVRDYKGDPSSTLLDILDKSQNSAFIDNYIEEAFDLSKVMFVLTANYVSDIPYELYDRLEIVELSSYTLLEKLEIAKKYLLPSIYLEHHIDAKNVKFSDAILKEIIQNYTNEAGVRELQRILISIVRKLIVLNHLENVKVTHEMLLKLLGPGVYEKTNLPANTFPGIVNVLAVNNTGGKVLPMESIFYDGTGKVKMTGHVEEIMKESMEVAISYIISKKDIFNIDASLLTKKDLHIHMLDAATKKDGPSAGIAITTSIISLLLKKSVSKSIAMTGEISLNGFVRKIGGLKEKLIGAYNEGIRKVFISKENHNGLEEIPEEVLEKLEIIEVENYEEIFSILFE